jgi:hypothetical protein
LLAVPRFRGGGARLDDARIDDEAMLVDIAHLQELTLSAGRKLHVRVRVA